MENTNHNALTLTVHIFKSINRTVGKIDAKIYGNPPVPTNNVQAVILEKPVIVESKPFDWDSCVVALGIVSFLAVMINLFFFGTPKFKIKA